MSPNTVRHPGELRWETNLLACVTLTLTGFGVMNCYGTGSYLTQWHNEAAQQLSGALVGGVAFIVAAYTDYALWRKLAKPMFYASLGGLGLIALFALIWPHSKAPSFLDTLVPYKLGAHRWIFVGVQIQVSEVVRFTLAAYLAMRAAEMGQRLRHFSSGFLPLIGVVGGTVLLVAVEPSVSMSIVLAAIGSMIVFTAGARITHLVPVGLLGGLALLAVLKLDTVRKGRVETASVSALECSPRKDQSCQSLIGFGSGGVVGVGFGEGMGKLGHLPLAYSDFLLSVIGEEWGFVGVLFVAFGFGLFCWLGLRIARTARDLFGTYLATGLVVAVGFTALFHTAVVTRMGPVTGLTLPFMSAGRSSLVLYLFSAGVIVNIGRRRGRPARQQ